MTNVHIILQGKGGIGKTIVATIIAQYLKDKGGIPLCLDTDPINASFASFPALKAIQVELMDNNQIHQARFDDMMEQILASEQDVVVDSGASSFIPLSTYLIENEVVRVLSEAGKQVTIHSVIAGGLALDNTLSDFRQVAKQLPKEAAILVWLNEYFGPIQANGKQFSDMKVYNEVKERVSGVIRIPEQRSDTFRDDIHRMLDKRLTFSETQQDETFRLMSKQRLKMVQRNLYEQIEPVLA